jgi:hypothetical protein
MRHKLSRRLEALEKSRAAAALRAANAQDSESAYEEIRAILNANNVAQGPDESAAATFARFLGISLRELRIWLIEGAGGHRQGVAV